MEIQTCRNVSGKSYGLSYPSSLQTKWSATIVSSAAKCEMDDLAEYIANDNEEAAYRFLQALEQNFMRLAEMPGIGPRWVSHDVNLQHIRVCTVPQFRNYQIFYRAIDNGIEVLHVFHAARDIESLLQAEDTEDT